MTHSEIAPLLTRPPVELAALIRSGELRSGELVEAALTRLEERQDLNAFTFVCADQAMAEAEQIRPGNARPFAGVPMAIKDLSPVRGQPWPRGSVFLAGTVAAEDAYAVRRLREAGFIFIGRTNAPEFGLVPVTESRLFGPARNPWDLDRTPGGSSGGAAAAVAGGILPVAHGSDGGGSIRSPAACCGVVGLKPSRGRISAGPFAGDSFLSTQGVISRTVADAAAVLDVLGGYEIGDATWAPPPAEPFMQLAARPPGTLRVAFTTASPLETEVHPSCAAAAHEAASLLADLGHEVEQATPPGLVDPLLIPHFNVVWAAQAAAQLRASVMVLGREPREEELEPLTWAFCRRGRELAAPELLGAIAGLQAGARRLVSFFSQYDVLLTPTTGQPPLRVGELDTRGADPMAEWAKAAWFTPFTASWNVTGQPAISLPLVHGEDGLPRGVQLVGPPLGEGLLLSLAAQLEAAYLWTGRIPPDPVERES